MTEKGMSLWERMRGELPAAPGLPRKLRQEASP